MRNYEVGLIFHPDTNPQALDDLLNKIKGWVTEAGGTVAKVDTWGKRRLAYAIRKQRDGVYAFLYADMPGAVPATLERNLRLTESILRFAIIRTGS
ncbi:MAG: 30S ribosomal protein S6 [Anaerolineales bacterium]|nr:30S ribosomal protein S6 [Anaerolineales bacterium]